uniref:Uncharacterized protein n=1 Tax=Physcomitrium patens TaxID=3218 RepID=A0A2K1IXU3_PHYPA|nr:hypothetical protein PHYPA_023919 [Physcomitrium patens]
MIQSTPFPHNYIGMPHREIPTGVKNEHRSALQKCLGTCSPTIGRYGHVPFLGFRSVTCLPLYLLVTINKLECGLTLDFIITLTLYLSVLSSRVSWS